MSQKILQINFNFSASPAEYAQACRPAAQPIADTSGLRWKVWLMNEAGREAGGIYLFDDDDSMRAFLTGPIVAAVQNDPIFSNISVKVFDVLEELTRITHGPLGVQEYA